MLHALTPNTGSSPRRRKIPSDTYFDEKTGRRSPSTVDVEELENRLVKSGLIDKRPILSEDEIVMAAIPPVESWVAQGVLSIEEISRLVHDWYMQTAH